MSTCRTCNHWTATGVPRWAFNMGMACCALKNTKAVTLNHWAACGLHQPAPADKLPERDAWLKRCGVKTPTNVLKTTPA